MSISRIKQIKRILKDHDARDPRGALLAIEQVVAQKNTNPRKPVAVIKVFDQPEGKGQLKSQVEIVYSERRLEPRHRFRHARFRQAERRGGGSEAAAVGDRDETGPAFIIGKRHT